MLNKIRKYYLDYFDIIRLKKNPQDVQVPQEDFLLLLAIYFITSFATAYVFLSSQHAMPFAVIDSLVVLIFLYVCLMICGYTNRWRQSTSAVIGCGIIFGVYAIPLLILVRTFQDVFPINSVVSFFLTLLIFWNIATNGHIFRHSFSILYIGGLCIAFLFYLLMNAVIILLMPEAFTA